jgi:hypothetical protein
MNCQCICIFRSLVIRSFWGLLYLHIVSVDSLGLDRWLQLFSLSTTYVVGLAHVVAIYGFEINVIKYVQ